MIFFSVKEIIALLDKNIAALGAVIDNGVSRKAKNKGVCALIDKGIHRNTHGTFILSMSSFVESWEGYNPNYTLLYPIGGCYEYDAEYDAGTLWHNPRRWEYLKHVHSELMKLREAFKDTQFLQTYMLYHVTTQLLMYQSRIKWALRAAKDDPLAREVVLKDYLGVRSSGLCLLLSSYTQGKDRLLNNQRVKQWVLDRNIHANIWDAIHFPANNGNDAEFTTEYEQQTHWLNDTRWEFVAYFRNHYKADLIKLIEAKGLSGLCLR